LPRGKLLTFAELLREHRRAANLSQQELADRARLSVNAIGALERGLRVRPRRDTVELLASALNLSQVETEVMMLARGHPHHSGQASDDRHRLFGRTMPLVGRSSELTWAVSNLRSGGSRLVTIAGPPGVGKTRLGEAVFACLRDELPLSAAIDLSRLAVPELLMSVIARTIGIPKGIGPDVDGVVEHFGDNPYLLLLDNFEHLLSEAQLVGELVARCPRLTVIVTSRSPLRLRDEQELHLAPLPLREAVTLFVQRARCRLTEFTVNATNHGVLEQICLKVDCLPLALELAAPWLKLMTPEELLSRLGSPMRILVNGPADLPERQRTIRAAIEWSHGLLDREEQRLFRVLSVFSGPASIEAIEELCHASGIERPLQLLAALIDKSMVVGISEGGTQRIGMLQTLREFGLDVLQASGQAGAARRAHAEWCLKLARLAEPELLRSGQADWIERLEQEHNNVRSALQWTRERDDNAFGLQLAGSLWQFWHRNGHLREGRDWLVHFLARASDAPIGARALALRGASGLSFRLLDMVSATRYGEASLALYRQLGDDDGTDAMLHNLAVYAWDRGDLGRALEMWQADLAVLRRRSRSGVTARPLDEAGSAGVEWEWRAIRLLETLAAVRRELGEDGLYPLGFTLLYLGGLYRTVGRLGVAQARLQEAVALYRHIGWPGGIVEAQNRLADIALDRLDPLAASATYHESLDTVKGIRDVSGAGYCIEGLAACAAMLRRRERAAMLYGAAASIRAAFGAPPSRAQRDEHCRIIARLRLALSEPAFRRAWSAGQALSFDEAVAAARMGLRGDVPLSAAHGRTRPA
jgi:predicted ATPase/transcriptional regulator with XRE-family HTH domain